jgi:hypothetical protein
MLKKNVVLLVLIFIFTLDCRAQSVPGYKGFKISFYVIFEENYKCYLKDVDSNQCIYPLIYKLIDDKNKSSVENHVDVGVFHKRFLIPQYTRFGETDIGKDSILIVKKVDKNIDLMARGERKYFENSRASKINPYVVDLIMKNWNCQKEVKEIKRVESMMKSLLNQQQYNELKQKLHPYYLYFQDGPGSTIIINTKNPSTEPLPMLW